MPRVEAAIKSADNEEEAYLTMPKEHTKEIPNDTVWAKIDDSGKLEILRWDLIEAFAMQYDLSKENRNQTHVMCKLLVLVRDQTREECA